MPTDGGLRKIFQDHIRDAHWVPVETWSTGMGVPDTEYCLAGASGWVEFKATNGWKVSISPEQVAWSERRLRAGGRCFLAVRRKADAGPRRGAACDSLYLYTGQAVRKLLQGSLLDCRRLYQGEGGPTSWDWDAIRRLLLAPPIPE